MNSTTLRLSLAATLLLGSAGAALAQDYQVQRADPGYAQQLQDYEAQKRDYENRTADYQSRRNTYAYQRDQYADQQERYAADRDRYMRDRSAYDARYGAGAWDRRYDWRDGYVYTRTIARNDYANSPCERRGGGNTVAGGVIGALAGAAIGSNIAGRGDRTEGAVLGGVAGAALGATIAGSSRPRAANCDSRGYYFTYAQTVPYREAGDYAGRNSGRYDYNYYRRSRCRLAIAPTYRNGDSDYRYVRVCPDRQGRYRITG